LRQHRHIAAFVLAGGRSSRMGREKGLLEFGGEPLIVRIVRLVEPLVHEVFVVGAPEPYSKLGLRAIADRSFRFEEGAETVRAPLVGIATALSETTVSWNLVLACDLPYLTPQWLDWLLERAANSEARAAQRTPS
jgi:molybdenum cofactor guanylyltransferase